jgi:hypothetical protein
MIVLNGDASTGTQIDHILGSGVSMDNGEFEGSWLNFTATDSTYQIHTLDFTVASGVTTRGLERAWGPTGTWNALNFYGDVNFQINGRRHAHHTNAVSLAGQQPSPFTEITSRYAPAGRAPPNP